MRDDFGSVIGKCQGKTLPVLFLINRITFIIYFKPVVFICSLYSCVCGCLSEIRNTDDTPPVVVDQNISAPLFELAVKMSFCVAFSGRPWISTSLEMLKA